MKSALPLAAVSLLLGGCATTLGYRPDSARSQEAAGLAARVVDAVVVPNKRGLAVATVAVRFAGAAGSLTRAWLRPADASACTGGVEATTSGGATFEPLATSTEKAIALQFRAASPGGLPPAPNALDLEVVVDGTPRCLTLPFAGGEARWRTFSDWFWGLSGRVNYLLGSSETFDAGSVFSIPVGRWLSASQRAWLEPGLGPLSGAGGRFYFSLGARAEQIFLQRGAFSLGGSVGYSARTTLPGFGAPEHGLLHGPQLALRLKFSTPPTLGDSGFPGGPEFGSWELLIPIDYWFGTGTGPRTVGFVPGFGIGVNFE